MVHPGVGSCHFTSSPSLLISDYVVVVDETLLDSVDVTEGLKEEGAIIINTKHAKEELLPKLNGYKGRVYTIDTTEKFHRREG